jgi:hypothetical protein
MKLSFLLSYHIDIQEWSATEILTNETGYGKTRNKAILDCLEVIAYAREIALEDKEGSFHTLTFHQK